MRYTPSPIEPHDKTVRQKYGSYAHYKAMHPEYHLYSDLEERLPKYCRLINKLEKANFELPLNNKGLVF